MRWASSSVPMPFSVTSTGTCPPVTSQAWRIVASSDCGQYS